LSKQDFSAALGAWEGYRIGTVQRFEGKGGDGSGAEVWIELLPCGDGEMVCSGCGGKTKRVHETAERWIRDLPILDAETRLLVHRVTGHLKVGHLWSVQSRPPGLG
jgi:hypothetical protein